ncbi:MAG TPA: cyclic nucleotide-binding domain-containing protein [Candidatus Deferrimicrobium sp.]|nr:cyclic nucleotide-binding domain-containing protein [Candidatus Deferrimicrobium sp.]
MSSVPPSSSPPANERDRLFLDNGSRVAVIGGGPAGTFFTYFLLEMAERIGMELAVDIYEPRDFTKTAPHGCNMCGGIVSESLVQLLATEGINLPSSVVQRGIDSYVLHMDVGTVRIEPTHREKRIAAVYRGGGPRGSVDSRWHSFDAHLLELARGRGAQVRRERVDGIDRNGGKPRVTTKQGTSDGYDLLVGAVGVNTGALKLFEEMGAGYRAPGTTKTYICELFLGEKTIKTYFGNSMHMFLLNLPRLEFAALIPKGDYVTMVMLGTGIDKALVESFFSTPEVLKCFPADWSPPADSCRCSPAINISAAVKPFADRMVLIGDSGVSRLYKDGIGGAYRTAKAAARTAVFEGVSEEDFRKGYLPVCRALSVDNGIGKVVFGITSLIQKTTPLRRGLLRMTAAEQESRKWQPRMSDVLWDTFTGSAPYKDVFRRSLHPVFLTRLLYETSAGMLPERREGWKKEEKVPFGKMGELGKVYNSGEIIVRQGDVGECMYFIQAGKVEVIRESDGKDVKLAELGQGEFFGEMALFEKGVRSATVRPLGEVRVLSVDKRLFLRKIHEDPALAFRIMQKMSRRIRDLDKELGALRSE